jgi:hypothetical protein
MFIVIYKYGFVKIETMPNPPKINPFSTPVDEL